jgi:N-acetylmuramoyl-L-alanine amidase
MFQNVYLENSISIAKKISDHIAEDADFINRGVKQAGFVILRKAAMPSVLIETGFLSNKNDEDFLRTAEGQQIIARSIGEAISEYKIEMEDEFEHLAALKEQTIESTEHSFRDSISGNNIVFRVQLAAISKDEKELPKFIAEQAIDLVYEDGLKKMVAGKFKDYESASSFKEIIRKESTFSEAFVVAYKGKERIRLNMARQLKQSHL